MRDVAGNAGISFVHQNLGLVPSLTVLENLLASDLATESHWRINWRKQAERAQALFQQYRLSIDPKSPYYNEQVLARNVGIRFKGVEKTNVEEYCVSEGWVRVTAGNAKDRYGNPLTIKVHGPVEAYFRDKAAS